MSRARLILALLCLLPLVLAGCGGPKSIARDTPQATGEALVAAIRAGDYDAAAAGFDFEEYAQRENPDWGTFAPQARKEIIGELQKAKATELQALSGMMGTDVSVGEGTIEGDRATVRVAVGPTMLRLQMIRKDGLWYILSVEEGAG